MNKRNILTIVILILLTILAYYFYPLSTTTRWCIVCDNRFIPIIKIIKKILEIISILIPLGILIDIIINSVNIKLKKEDDWKKKTFAIFVARVLMAVVVFFVFLFIIGFIDLKFPKNECAYEEKCPAFYEE